MAIVGPPVILFYFSSPLGLTVGRASLVAFFLGTDTVGSALLAVQGFILQETLLRTLAFGPLVLLAASLGNRGFLGLPEARFRSVVLGLLIALALAPRWPCDLVEDLSVSRSLADRRDSHSAATESSRNLPWRLTLASTLCRSHCLCRSHWWTAS